MAKSPTRISLCPPIDTIAQLISGSLDEIDAERLFQHIDECDQCQRRVGELERRADGILVKAQDVPGVSADQKQLSSLIRKAQNLGDRDSGVAEGERSTIPVGNFVTSLRRCGLFEEKEVDSLLSEMEPKDSSTMAKALVSKKKLTPFQARVLLKGRWKGLVLGNYELLDKLGQGGMGSVFRARHRRLRRIVCVKVMNSAGRKSPQMIERFRNEARTVAALSHPNFVVAHDADEAEGVPFLVMEYVEGSDLAKYVAANGPLPVDQALQLTVQAAIALQYAHDEGVTHRDIKPHNLLLSKDADTGEDSVKILDMGLARFDALLCENPDASTHAAMTNTGVIMGTVDYMSPEQAIRSRDADNRSDIYSLGCTLHFLLTGQPVFTGDTIMARLIAHREQQIPSLQELRPQAPPQLDAVFHRMLAKKPQDRYQSMQAVADDLSAVLNGREPMAQPVQHHEPSQPVSILEQRRERRRKPAYGMWMTIAGGFLLCGLGLWSVITQAQPESATRTTSSPTRLPVTANSNTAGSGTNSAVAKTKIEDVLQVPVNHDDSGTILAGGRGKALLVVPWAHYRDKDCQAWEEAITAAGMDLAYASSKMESPRPIDDPSHKIARDRMVPLHPFNGSDYDIVVLVGGSVDDFNRQPQTRYLDAAMAQALSSGAVICRMNSDDYGAVSKAQNSCGAQKREGAISYATTYFGDGTIASCKESKLIPQAISEARNLRLAQRTRRGIGVTSFLDTLKREGVEIMRGGKGRALVVLPMKSFNSRDYQELRKTLANHNVSIVIGSSALGFPQADGRNAQTEMAALQVSKFEPAYFDAVFLVGGSVDEFRKDAGWKSMSMLVQRALEKGIAVAATSKNAREIFASLDVEKYLTENHQKKVTFGMLPDSPGALLFAEAKHMGSLVDKTMSLRTEAVKNARKKNDK